MFAAVNMAHVKLAKWTHRRRWTSVVAASAGVGALVALVSHIATTRPVDLLFLLGILVATFVGEANYERRRRRHPVRGQQPGQ